MANDRSANVDASLERILTIFNARTGLSFRPHNMQDVEFRVRRCMSAAGARDLAHYALLMETDQDVLDELIVELTVGETYFFRDPKQFEFLRTRIIPELLAHRPANSTIRAWSAGCASGEEAYSLAMLFDQMGLIDRCQILGTDISSRALLKCREGKYREWSFRNGMAEQAKRYMRKTGENYEVIDHIRRPVRFGHLNLSFDSSVREASSSLNMDIILCRNVLIYFDRQTIQSVAARLYHSLTIGGWLVTAAGDPSLDEFAPFRPVVTEWGVFYQRAASVASGKSTRQRVEAGLGYDEHDSAAFSMDDTVNISSPPTLRNARLDSAPAAAGKPMWREPDREPVGKQSRPVETAEQAVQGQVKAAVAALAVGDYERAVKLTANCLFNEAACIVHVKALANVDTMKAERVCEQATRQHSMSPELQFLRAALLIEVERYHEAEGALNRVLFLDRSLAIVHFTLGTVLAQMGDFNRAEKAFRNAHALCRDKPPNDTVPLTDSERAGHLASAAEIQLSHLARLRS